MRIECTLYNAQTDMCLLIDKSILITVQPVSGCSLSHLLPPPPLCLESQGCSSYCRFPVTAKRSKLQQRGYGEEKTPIRSHYNFHPRLNWIVIPWTIFCCGPEPYLLHLLTSQVQLFTNWTQYFNLAWKHTIEVELNEHFCISVVSIFPKI